VRMPHVTSLLSGISMAARARRVRFTPVESYFSQVTDRYAEVWFPSSGCPWDAIGHCTTCNYGAPAAVGTDAMVRAVELAAAELLPTTEVLWVSAFDSLHEREVPAEARRRIFEILATTPARTILTEAHPASVRPAALAECVELLQGRTLGVQLGVETMDEFVRYACVNKPFSNSTLERAVRTLHAAGATAWANLIVGIPFLSRHEVVSGTVKSIRDTAAFGFDQIVLFPNHVKEHTVAHIMATAGRYQPPDLWVMRDVLAGVPGDLNDRVYLAWLELKPHPGAPRTAFAQDRAATAKLRELLHKFNTGRDRDALRAAIELPDDRPATPDPSLNLVERLISEYQWLADQHWELGWWEKHAAEVKAELEAGYARTRESAPLM
jgi:radical SAM enzyme (TIGR01210 family)